MGEKEKLNGLCTMERGRKEEMKRVRSGLMLEACLPPKAMVKLLRIRLNGEVCSSPRVMVMSGPGWCQGPCLGPWSHSSQGLC